MSLNKKVIVGLSGGVDSSVAAVLLKEQGYDVIGASLDLWKPNNSDTSSAKDARLIAEKLGIPFHIFDYSVQFQEHVVDYFINEYKNARTPNPCVMCNRYIKFKGLISLADSLGADYIATGHYAGVFYEENSKRYILKKSVYDRKDQSYFLYNLTQDQLKRVKFPLYDYSKDKIREIAGKNGLISANKPDSQEICFIPNGNYVNFIEKYSDYASPPGLFVDTDGNVLGQHKGIIHYTVGQRKGLGVTFGKPMFVLKINKDDNTIILGEQGNEFSSELIARDCNFISLAEIPEKLTVQAKNRYAARPCNAELFRIDDKSVKVVFSEPQRAITPGQSVVFYDGDIVVGGGVILG